MNFRISCLSLLILLFAVIILNLSTKLHYFLVPFDKTKYRLFVAIFSARDHFKQRETIRQTWKRLFADENKIVFFVGDRDCDVPKSHLHDLYSCNLQKFNTSLISNTDKLYSQRITEFKSKATICSELHVGFAFQVNS